MKGGREGYSCRAEYGSYVSSEGKELELNTSNVCVLALFPVTLLDLLFGIFILGHPVYVTQTGVQFLAEA